MIRKNCFLADHHSWYIFGIIHSISVKQKIEHKLRPMRKIKKHFPYKIPLLCLGLATLAIINLPPQWQLANLFGVPQNDFQNAVLRGKADAPQTIANPVAVLGEASTQTDPARQANSAGQMLGGAINSSKLRAISGRSAPSFKLPEISLWRMMPSERIISNAARLRRLIWLRVP